MLCVSRRYTPSAWDGVRERYVKVAWPHELMSVLGTDVDGFNRLTQIHMESKTSVCVCELKSNSSDVLQYWL